MADGRETGVIGNLLRFSLPVPLFAVDVAARGCSVDGRFVVDLSNDPRSVGLCSTNRFCGRAPQGKTHSEALLRLPCDYAGE